jgi:S1-C subfamily serine protease
VLGIDPEGPAARAGLIPTRITPDGRIVVGDRIVGLGDTKIDDASDLIGALERYSPGNTVDLLVLRGGQQLRVAITLGKPS